MSIQENIAEIRRRIAVACAECGRDPKEITLVGASKMNDAAACREAIAAGIDVLGENRVQEMTEKLAQGAYEGAPLHFIGHLQRNKVKQVVGKAALIQSVGSLPLLEAVEKEAEKQGIVQDILLEVNIGGEEVTCPHAHGEQDIEEALANSCNGVFGQLAVELGGETMQKYADAAGLTKSIKVDGIQSSVGKFDFSGNDNQLAWSGVGQGQDTLCPINMLQYMGAIANGGKAAVPRLIEKSTTDYGLPTGIYYPHKSAQLIDEKTAGTIADMMHNNVIETYGQDRFPGMDICAKSGTAEVGADKSPNAWFTGFLRDEATPYAFIVLVENGGGGSSVAGTVASQVLQAAVEKAY